MKVVIFGGSGFIGSHVADELTKQGHEVRIFDLKESKYLKKEQKMIKGDILDVNDVTKAVEGCDVVYSFAGLADLDAASGQPVKSVELNILGTVNILEACVKAKVKRFVYASTIYVYSKLGGFYRCSKQATESYIEEYHRKYCLDFTILRYGTVYGPRADESNSVYRYIKQALSEKKITCPGTGEEIREYIHVKDVAKLSIDVLADEYRNTHVTITGQHPTRYRDMILTIKEMLGGDIDVEFNPPEENSAHYTRTPYSFTPKLGKKLVSNYYVDLGQGLLECAEDVKRSLDEGKDA